MAGTERPRLYTMDAAIGRDNVQPWNQGGPVPREPVERDPVWISSEDEDSAKAFLGEWMAHVDAGRIGPHTRKAKAPEVTAPKVPVMRTFGLNSPEAYEFFTGRKVYY